MRLGVLRPAAALWCHLSAEFGTLGDNDGPADAVLELAVLEDAVLRHGDMVDLELVLEPPADVAPSSGEMRNLCGLSVSTFLPTSPSA